MKIDLSVQEKSIFETKKAKKVILRSFLERTLGNENMPNILP
jgi:hypothetical protein